MVKLVFCLKRKEGMSREEFLRYWREVHAPLVRKHAAVLGISRYVQCHTVEHALNNGMRTVRGAPDEYDGVAELWWESFDAVVAGGDEAVAAGYELVEDERKFIDLENSPLWFTEEHVVIAGS